MKKKNVIDTTAVLSSRTGTCNCDVPTFEGLEAKIKKLIV